MFSVTGNCLFADVKMFSVMSGAVFYSVVYLDQKLLPPPVYRHS